MKQIIVLLLSIFMVTTIHAQVDYSKWNSILSRTVSDEGRVQYRKIQSDFSEELTDFLSLLENTDPGTLDQDEKLAFWINTYNAFTVRLIIDHFPVSSIRDIDKGNPWDQKRIRIKGHPVLSLNDIEHEIIRKEFNEPRIHFAVNCAAQSCPPLLNRAYTPQKLDEQLEAQTVAFINNLKFNSFAGNRAEVSQLFNWYKEDFGDIISYINRYLESPKIKRNAQVAFKEYDWSLNN